MAATRVLWRITTAVVVAAIGSLGADFEHFTWWAIAWWAIFGMLEELGYGRYAFWFFQTIQLLVISGVVIMGAMACTVFSDAYRRVGPVKFILGNFVMHYLPSLEAYALSTREHIECGEHRAMVQIWAALGVFLIWHHLRDPWAVYGCSLPHSLGITGMLLVTLAIQVTSTFLAVPTQRPKTKSSM